ncbi:hypothetical protein E2C01_057773 [Portunus trituberculatus]|uniref:Uncharacterized protein n=1 Tax=Portunus trituberculatus TaxID=210409 RepID=A0A5B7GXX3_PORTR|nr:hypothetical protein [Portunus trituberculatus]
MIRCHSSISPVYVIRTITSENLLNTHSLRESTSFIPASSRQPPPSLPDLALSLSKPLGDSRAHYGIHD